jgi:hypothetical protein
MEKLAYSYKAACAILDAKGYTEAQIINYVENAEKPTAGYIFIDESSPIPIII